ncbi:MAG: hypothetical protein M0Z54_11480 [Thermaerobacter sp.]|nr:hypothetical protein [Thermaerobacter sp.]
MKQLGFVDATGEALSPMAAALAKAMLGAGWQVEAWALAPAQHVDPQARQSLAEWGLEVDAVPPRRFVRENLPRPSIVIALGPVPAPAPAPDITWLHWPLPNRGSGLVARRSQRDRIRHRLETWGAEFG